MELDVNFIAAISASTLQASIESTDGRSRAEPARKKDRQGLARAPESQTGFATTRKQGADIAIRSILSLDVLAGTASSYFGLQDSHYCSRARTCDTAARVVECSRTGIATCAVWPIVTIKLVFSEIYLIHHAIT